MTILMMRAPGYKHTGYTKAVDWWSLGVTIYRLLTGLYPFATDIPIKESRDAYSTEGSERYMALLESVDYSSLSQYPDAVSFISELLVVDDKNRLGFGIDGSASVAAHRFFCDLDWVELEKKQLQPPPLPGSCIPHRPWRGGLKLKELLRMYRRDDWLEPFGAMVDSEADAAKVKAINNQLDIWDYASPAAVLAELS